MDLECINLKMKVILIDKKNGKISVEVNKKV